MVVRDRKDSSTQAGKENLLKAVRVKAEDGSSIEKSEHCRTRVTRGNQNNNQIVALDNWHLEDLRMNRIARELRCNAKVVHDHKEAHNQAVERSTFCLGC